MKFFVDTADIKQIEELLPTGFVDDVEKNPKTDLGKLFYETNKRSNQMNEYIDKENHFYEKFKQLVLNDKITNMILMIFSSLCQNIFIDSKLCNHIE